MPQHARPKMDPELLAGYTPTTSILPGLTAELLLDLRDQVTKYGWIDLLAGGCYRLTGADTSISVLASTEPTDRLPTTKDRNMVVYGPGEITLPGQGFLIECAHGGYVLWDKRLTVLDIKGWIAENDRLAAKEHGAIDETYQRKRLKFGAEAILRNPRAIYAWWETDGEIR